MAAASGKSTSESLTGNVRGPATQQAPHLRHRRVSAQKLAASAVGSDDDTQVTECEMPAVQYKPFMGPAHPKYTTTIDETPAFLRDTYILSGYRHLTYSYRMCFHSLTYLHNETGNVLTHFFALVFFIGLIISTNYNLLPQGLSPGRSSWGDYVVFYGYLLSACVCFLLSSMFHLFSCHSHSHHVAWLKCDFVGILFLILGSLLPGLYYGYYESRGMMWTYMAMSFTLFLVGIVISVSPHLQKPSLRWLRPVVFFSISLSGAFPVTHHVIAHGVAMSAKSMGFYYTMGMFALYVAGTLLYAFNIPERWFPGRFDIIGNSHQLFHMLVFFAALTHFYGIVQAFKWHHSAQAFS